MNLLAIYMDSHGNITELTLSCPLTYMLLGLFFYAIAMGSALGDMIIPCFVSFIAGSLLFITSLLLYLFQSNQSIFFLVIIGILSLILIFMILKKIRSCFFL